MRKLAWLPLLGLLLAACGAGTLQAPLEDSAALNEDPQASTPLPAPTQATEQVPAANPTAVDPELINRRVPEFDAYVPPQLIPLDGIRPVYGPVFSSAGEAPLDDDELVIGIALNGEAKAYPITVLRFREMVNDELGGLPILVTW